MIEELCKAIWDEPRFHVAYQGLIKNHLTINLISASKSDLKIEVNPLLQAASHFSLSEDSNHKEAAFKIAVASLEYTKDCDNESFVRNLVKVIFGRLGNFPSISRISKKSLIDEHEIPSPLWFELNSHFNSNSITLPGLGTKTFTDFQINLWESMGANKDLLAVTAPTSAGKSYALKSFFIDMIGNKQQGVFAYIVPTRALINQVVEDFYPDLKRVAGNKIIVTTAPTPREELNSRIILYVLTQERLQNLLEFSKDVRFEYVVVDEAQMIEEDSRGIILQNVIENLLFQSPKTKIMFGCPFVYNPEVFHAALNIQYRSENVLKESLSPVGQNLIVIKNARSDSHLNISVVEQSKETQLGEVKIDSPYLAATSGENDNDRLAAISHFLSKDSSSIVYSGGPASCESIAKKLTEYTDSKINNDEIIKDFCEFLRQQVHPDYPLIDTIESGVGFHYGKMPSVVRKTIEDLFSEGRLSFIVCTSTLLHGVNLPAKNLFLRNPTKGKDWLTHKTRSLNAADFWNLAGRAGRLGKEFEGNVFLVDYDDWDEKPLDGKKERQIVPALQRTLTDANKEFLNFVSDKDHASGKHDRFEVAFMRLYVEQNEARLGDFLAKRIGLSGQVLQDSTDTIALATSNLSIPVDLAVKNPTVSVLRQQELYDYFMSKITTLSEAEDRCPPHPMSQNSYKGVLRVFWRIHKYFEKKSAQDDKSPMFFAKIAGDWMRGDPLSRMIKANIEYKRRILSSEPRVSTAIRDTMEKIESDLRFRYVRNTKCHNDIFEYVLLTKGFGSVAKKIPALPLYLEFGASSKTMINLIGNGISRTTAGILSAHLKNNEMSIQEVETWLQKSTWEKLDIPLVCKRELKKHLGRQP